GPAAGSGSRAARSCGHLLAHDGAVALVVDQEATVHDAVLELVPEMAQETLHRPRGRLAEGADGVAFDLPGGGTQHVQVVDHRGALDDAADHAVHPAGALAARGALAAAFLHVEARDALAGADHAGGLDRKSTRL